MFHLLFSKLSYCELSIGLQCTSNSEHNLNHEHVFSIYSQQYDCKRLNIRNLKNSNDIFFFLLTNGGP